MSSSENSMISDEELTKIIKHYYKSFGSQFKTWLRNSFDFIDDLDFLDFYKENENDDDTLYQNIYILEDSGNQLIKVVIQYNVEQPVVIDYTILDKINDFDVKKGFMTFLSNSIMSIKYLISIVQKKYNKTLDIKEDSMFLYHKSFYLGYYVTFETKETENSEI